MLPKSVHRDGPGIWVIGPRVPNVKVPQRRASGAQSPLHKQHRTYVAQSLVLVTKGPVSPQRQESRVPRRPGRWQEREAGGRCRWLCGLVLGGTIRASG